jgi:hypothetical protein
MSRLPLLRSPRGRVGAQVLVALASFAVPLSPGQARAQEIAPYYPPAPAADQTVAEDRDARRQIDRTWLYGDDARVAAPLTIVATMSVSYTSIGADPTYVSSPYPNQPAGCFTAAGKSQACYSTFAGNTAQPGGELIMQGELGVVPHVSILGNVMVGGSGGVAGVPSPDVGGTVALRFQAFPLAWTHAHLAISGGYVREAYNPPVYNDDVSPAVWIPGQPGGINAAFLQFAFSGDISRLRVGAMVHGQHTFADGRDPLDIMVDLGASYRLVGGLRAGVEYVGQDLEESFSPGAEGGARHFLGPIVSLQLLHDRLTLVGGPAVGLSSLSPDFVARLAASVGF